MISLGGRKISGIRYGSTSVKEVRVGNRLVWSPEANFVAVGQNGRVMYSPDGCSWYSGAAGTANLMSVCYGNGRFVAVGEDGAYATSTDGKTWTVGSKGSGVWNRVCYGNGNFVAVGCTSKEYFEGMGVIMYSPDGISWTVKNTSTGDTWRTWYDVCFGDGKFAAVGMRHVDYTSRSDEFPRAAYSTSLTTWQERDVSLDTTSFTSIVYDGAKFVAACCGYDEKASKDFTAVVSSTNVTSWKILASLQVESQSGSKMCFGKSQGGIYAFVNGSLNYTTSTDASTWHDHSVNGVPIPRTSFVRGICHGKGRLVAVGNILAVSGIGEDALTYVGDACGSVLNDVCFKEV